MKAPGQVADPTVPLPPRYSHLEERGYKAMKYGNTINMRGPGLSTHIMDEIIGKQRNNESVVIVVTGSPGKGKTYLALRWAQKLDQRFHVMDTPPPPPKQDHGQATFDRAHIQHLVGKDSPLKRGQVIVMDEFHFGGGARSWQQKDQKKLVNLIAAIRSKGLVLIIVVLHTKMVDSMIRDFVLNYEFSVRARGKAVAYRRWFPDHGDEPWKKRLGKMKMQMPDESRCNFGDCFKCGALNASKNKRCETTRAIYERRKEWFLNKQTEADEKEEEKNTYTEQDDALEIVSRNSANIPRKKNKDIHKGRCVTWFKEIGINVRLRDSPQLIEKIIERFGK